MSNSLRWSYRSFAIGVASALAGLGLLGFIQPPQSVKDLEAQGWQPSWKDDDGKWQPPWIGRWEDVAVAITDINAGSNGAFHSSVRYWHSVFFTPGDWTYISPGDLTEPLHLEGPANVLIEGDCLADITIAKQGLVHVLGNVASTISVGESSEVVIAGSVMSTGTFRIGPVGRVYVGGDFDGVARDTDADWWIGGDVHGTLQLGRSSCYIDVKGDFLCSVDANRDGGLALVVAGYMPSKTLYSIAKQKPLYFHGSIGISDERRGLYPRKDYDNHVEFISKNVRWTVHKAREVKPG